MFLAAIGIVGGLGAFLYGPILTICFLLVVLGLHRSKAVAGLHRSLQVLAYSTVIVLSLALFFALGLAIERHKDHPVSIGEIAKLIPRQDAAAQTTNIYQTFEPPPASKSPRIEFSSFDLASMDSSGASRWQTMQNNAGDEEAIDVAEASEGKFLELSSASEDMLFASMSAHRGSGTYDQPPGLKNAIYAPLDVDAPTPGERLEYMQRKKVLYLGRLVTYRDSRGNAFRTEICEYVFPGYHLRNMCSNHNASRMIKRQK